MVGFDGPGCGEMKFKLFTEELAEFLLFECCLKSSSEILSMLTTSRDELENL